MMHIAKPPPKTPVPAEPQWAEAHVALALIDDQYLLDDGRLAQQAVSCLIAPAAGDRVLIAACKEGEQHYIVHVLSRPHGADACLSVPGVQHLTVRQPRIDLNATEHIAVRALHDVEVTAAAGVLALNARSLFTTVSESLVENIHHYIGNIEHYLLEVKQLLRLHGKQAVMTAEQDVKVDAERISIG